MPAATIIDGSEDEYDLPITDHPHFTVLPALNEPGILTGGKPEDAFRWKVHAYHNIPKDMHERLEVPIGSTVQVRSAGEIYLPTFCRAIAKIAYCNWVAVREIGSIRPLRIIDFILGKYPYASYLVGSESDEPPPAIPGTSHTIKFSIKTQGRLRLVVASLQLFASSGTDEMGFPEYLVVLGTPKSL